jgi:hypothetical protein
MVSRGYDGEIRTLPTRRLSQNEIWLMIGGGIVLSMILLIGLMTGG